MSIRRYSLGVPAVTGILTAAPMLQILAGLKPVHLRDIQIRTNGAAAQPLSIGLVRSLAVGTGTNAMTPIPHRPQDSAPQVRVYSTWSVAPTMTGADAKRELIPALVAASVLWLFGAEGEDRDIPTRFERTDFVIKGGESALIWNYAATTAPDTLFNLTIEED